MKKYYRAAALVALFALLAACQKELPLPLKEKFEIPVKSEAPKAKVVVETKPPVQKAVFKAINRNTGGFYQALPASYASTSQRYPLLIFCHGLGELGDGSPAQLPEVLRNGPPKLISRKEFPADFKVDNRHFSFIVLSPQFKKWPSEDDINAVIDYAVKHYRVDTTRIYLTGLSMGGGVVWNYAGKRAATAHRLAAIVPVCGASYPSPVRAGVIASANLPVWALHNRKDPTVTSANSVKYVAEINAHTPHPDPKAKLTLFPVSGHNAWSKAYDPAYSEKGLNVYEWMLQYHR